MSTIPSVRGITLAEVNLVKKAIVWIKDRSLKDDTVKINQLASTLRVKVTKAADIVATLLPGMRRDEHSINDLRIFVVNDKVPDWLRSHLNINEILRLVSTKRVKVASLLTQRIHRQVLLDKYDKQLIDVLTSRYRSNEHVAFNALSLIEIDQVPRNRYNYKFDLDFYIERHIGGQDPYRIHYTLKGGTRVTINHGQKPFSVLDDLSENPVEIELHEVHTCTNTVSENLILKHKTERLIGYLHQYGLHLMSIDTRTCGDIARPRTALTFVAKTDFIDTVDIILPWDFVIFEVKR